jgi:hypothetical protein
MLTPHYPSSGGSLKNPTRVGGQPKEKGTSGHASPCPKCRHYSPRVRCNLRAGRGPDSRLRGLQQSCGRRGLFHHFHRGLSCVFLAERVRGRTGGGDIPRRGLADGGRRHDSFRRGGFPGWRRFDLGHGSRPGSGIRRCLRASRLLCLGFARNKLQPRGTAVLFSAIQVAASILPARPLIAWEVRSRGHGFPESESGGRLCNQISGKGRPTKKAPHN